MVTKAILIALFVVSCGWLTACNTVEGVGKDTKSAGQHIENAAK